MKRKFFPALLAGLMAHFQLEDPSVIPEGHRRELHAKRGYFGARGEFHPRKHTKSSYRAQQRAAKKCRNK